ncbi:MAG: hypothetical protein ACR2K1_04545 [Saprospiraceae bacterium]
MPLHCIILIIRLIQADIFHKRPETGVANFFTMLNRMNRNAYRIRAASPDDPSTIPWQVVLLPPLLLFFRKAVQILAGADAARIQQPLPAVAPPLSGCPPGVRPGRIGKTPARTRDFFRIIFELYQRIRARPAPLSGRYSALPPRFSPATGYPAVSSRAPNRRSASIRGEPIVYPVRRRYGMFCTLNQFIA